MPNETISDKVSESGRSRPRSSTRPTYNKSGQLIMIDDALDLLGLVLKVAAKPAVFSAKQLYDAIVKQSNGSHTRAQVRRAVYYARRKDYVDEAMSITDKGAKRLRQLRFDTISAPPHWDGIWRIIVFDVPETHRYARNKVRVLIRQLGFMQLQKSVWVHPFPCTHEFVQIQEAYGADHHISIIEARSIDNDHQLRQSFAMAYPETSGFDSQYDYANNSNQ